MKDILRVGYQTHGIFLMTKSDWFKGKESSRIVCKLLEMQY